MKKIFVSSGQRPKFFAEKLEKELGYKILKIKKNHFRVRINFFTEARCWLEDDHLWIKAGLNGKPLQVAFALISIFFYIIPGLMFYLLLHFSYFRKIENKVSLTIENG